MTALIEQARWLEQAVGVRALDLGAIRVDGDDARAWLNGQISNDVSDTREGDSVYALLLEANGRILTDLYALDRGDAFDLLVPRARLADVREHLERFIVMEDVDLEAREVEVISAQGPRASELDGFTCDRLGHGGTDRLDGDLDAIVERAQELGGGLVSPEAWELARLRAGRPALGADFDATVFPQEAGLAELAVSFAKGCYVGQEVVCMLENRGQLRRRLVQLRADALPAPGSRLMFEGVEVGTIRSGVFDPEAKGAWVHAIVKRARAEVGLELELAPHPPGGTSAAVTVRKILGSRAEERAL